ncbi:MAG: hypothetical protein MUP70_13495 [Candidatus Aminicenantes bacterium]|nr:hypothetical protein [Candidatus Aminicenantes bacterium]
MKPKETEKRESFWKKSKPDKDKDKKKKKPSKGGKKKPQPKLSFPSKRGSKKK